METPSIYAPPPNTSLSYEINDIRMNNEFRGITFSGYKKVDVIKQLIESMKKVRLEHAANWSAELICAGHYGDLWEAIIHYAAKHIHLGNPKIAMYLDMRYDMFRNIMNKGHFASEIQLRNNLKIRQLFAETISVLVLSNKKPSFEAIKINRLEEFDITQMTERLKAPNASYIDLLFRPDDPKEIYIVMNEFAYNVSVERRNMMMACYWVEWIIEFDILCRKRKEPLLCDRRSNVNIDYKFQKDIIWIIWDILSEYAERTKIAFLSKAMHSLFNLFCVKYTTSSSKKRRYLIYFAVALLTEPVCYNVPVVSNKEIVQKVVDNINEVYRQIKQNEASPGTEYLFNYLEKQNHLEQSLQQMELMNNMDELYK